MAWVKQSIVNIGENATTGPHIKGSVYGGGENGHVFTHATVNVKSGTIGIVNEADPWYSFIPEGMAETDPLYATYEAIEKKAWATRGNVYGSGCGTDTYTGDDGKEHHNTWAGCVIGNTDVNISGGWVAQSVYGGGSLGSVGRVLEGPSAIVEHREPTEEFALSWPVKYSYENLSVTDPVFETDSTGKAVVNITGGRIGTTGSDNGDVFGGSRGEAGAPYVNAQLANVRKTEVNINYGSTPTDAAGLGIIENYDKVQNPPVSKERFASVRDSLVMQPCVLNANEGDGRKENITVQIDKAFPSDAYTQFLQSYEGGLGQYGPLLSFGTNYDLVMPGRVLDAGMGQYDGDVIHYRLGGEQMIPGAYTISATSRVTNIWAFIVTFLVIILAIGSFFYRRKAA